jgi:hypothetical protein
VRPSGLAPAGAASAAIKNIAPVAQLDRVLGYEPSGREFESLRARQKLKGPFLGPFCFCRVLDEDENTCSIKRASVLDAAGAAQR